MSQSHHPIVINLAQDYGESMEIRWKENGDGVSERKMDVTALV
jgi:hypothetical protein